MPEPFDPSAALEKIRAHLSTPSGIIMISTYLKSTQYEHKHRDMFYLDRENNVRVKQGKSSVVIATPNGPLVSVKFYRYQ